MWLWWRSSIELLFFYFGSGLTLHLQGLNDSAGKPPHMCPGSVVRGKGQWADDSWQGCVIQQGNWHGDQYTSQRWWEALNLPNNFKEVFGCATSWVMMHLRELYRFWGGPYLTTKLIHRLVFWPWLLCLPVPLNVYFLHAIYSTVKLEYVGVGWLLKSYDVRTSKLMNQAE